MTAKYVNQKQGGRLVVQLLVLPLKADSSPGVRQPKYGCRHGRSAFYGFQHLGD
jgi:hypothetical protein